MSYFYFVVVYLTTFLVTLPCPPCNQVSVQQNTDTIYYSIADSCIAWRCFRNTIPNVGVWNYQTNQMITGARIDSIPAGPDPVFNNKTYKGHRFKNMKQKTMIY